MNQAACKGIDPELFFPRRNEAHKGHPAIRVCNNCPVKTECLAYALERPEKNGIWGGTSEKQRRALRRGIREQREARCGTPAGYRRHLRLEEPACPDCLNAHSRENRFYRAIAAGKEASR